MRRALCLVAVVACGRSNFEVRRDAGSDGGTMTSTRCVPPPRPDVSTPRVTVSDCSATVIENELVQGGIVQMQCARVLQVAPMVIATDTIIDGHGVVFDGQNATPVFDVRNGATLTLLDVTVANGSSGTYGAGVQIEVGSSLVAYDATFHDNHGPVADPNIGGGAIAAMPDTATAKIYGGSFFNNTSANGGAILSYADLVVMNATISNNAATGTGGSSGMGGQGGGIALAGTGNLSMCGVSLLSNAAGSFGGGLFHVSTNNAAIDHLQDVAMDFNSGGGGGGAYIQSAVSVTLRNVSATSNLSSAGGGGLWILLGALDAENLSVVYNRADSGTGAGIELGSVTGRLAFSTISENKGNCASCVDSALAGTTVDLKGTVISDNVAPSSPVACDASATSSGANFQWPGDLPLCATGATVTDPFLLPHAMVNGPAGTFLVRKPAAGSPIIGVASGCPADDILGNPRPTPCAAGAVEP